MPAQLNVPLKNYPVRYSFDVFYHPFVCDFIKALNAGGIDGLLKWQRKDDGTEGSVQKSATPGFFAEYSPYAPAMAQPYPYVKEIVDFSFSGAYSQYNWELFFHAPMLIATQLSANQRFEEAQRWFHYVFDPTDGSSQPDIARFWKFLPFAQAKNPHDELEELIKADSTTKDELTQEVAVWRLSPFQPHPIARHRSWSYPRAVVMKYIDNIIAAGDQHFRQETLESINIATLYYILAADILGPRPTEITPQVGPPPTTYSKLKANLNTFSDAMVDSENLAFGLDVDGHGGGPQLGLPQVLEFCVPKNDQLLGYWDTVEQRLFNIRHCMNIEGVVRALPLFEPPIDVGALVRAAASGVDLSSVLSDMFAPLPHYRFSTMLQKAIELCADVRSLGSALLTALEKRDAEALALLRSGHEMDLLAAMRQVKEQQVNEARGNWDALNKSKVVIQARFDYYSKLISTLMNPWELEHASLLADSKAFQELQGGAQTLAAVIRLLPELKIGAPTGMGATFGGANVADALQIFGSIMGFVSASKNIESTMAATQGSYHRRLEEWVHQAGLASKELDQMDGQIAVADLRHQIAELELANHDKQAANAKAVDDFMRSQFANEERLDWMVAQTAGLYFQSYQMAYDMARRAEKCFQFERAVEDSGYIKFGYWDSLKKGLLSGERLHYDLRRMEVGYLDQNQREFELTKHISLAMLAPEALVLLKQAGDCFVEFPEDIFDFDYPGHYLRRIKSVAITIPCIAGPYTGVNCTLTLIQSSVRVKNTLNNQYGRVVDPNSPPDDRFRDQVGMIQQIATSNAQNDSGTFERDERYQPFEFAGAISQWRLQLPPETNRFARKTISDVIFHVRYTDRHGGEQLERAALAAMQKAPKSAFFSARQEFPNDWYQFLHPLADQTLGLDLSASRFPYQLAGKTVTIQSIKVFLQPKDSILAAQQGLQDVQGLNVSCVPEGTADGFQPLLLDPLVGSLPATSFDKGGAAGRWVLKVQEDPNNNPKTLRQTVTINNVDHHWLSPDAIEDIGILCSFSVS